MLKDEFARIFAMNEAEVDRLADLSRKAQELGFSAEPEVGLFFLSKIPVGCIANDVFFVIDNQLYDQFHDARPGHPPLGEGTFVPDWDAAYAWARSRGWSLSSNKQTERGVEVTLSRGDAEARGLAESGRVAMLEAAVKATGKDKGV